MSHKETAVEFIRGAGREVSFAVVLGIGATTLLIASRRSDWEDARTKETEAYQAKSRFEGAAMADGNIASQTPGWKDLDDAAQQASRDRMDAEEAWEAEEDI